MPLKRQIAYPIIFFLLLIIMGAGLFFLASYLLPGFVESKIISILKKDAGITDFALEVHELDLDGANLGSLRIGTPENPALVIRSIHIDYSPREVYQKKVDKIVGIDARGFLFGSVLAYKLDIGFIPVRKNGKLPYKTISESYTLEYGQETIEIHEDAIAKGERVVIVDDLIATGGTIAAAANLVERLGGNIIECSFVVELPDLKGREKLGDRKVFSIVEFEGE